MKNTKFLISLFSIVFLINVSSLNAQTEEYLPKGDPNEWNVELTPFLWLPAISGDITIYNSEDFTIPASDLLSNLKMAFMITADVSKGKFFAAPTYFYTKLGNTDVLKTFDDGEEVSVDADLKMNVFELIAGARFRVNKQLIIDPFVGFRYSSYNISGTVNRAILEDISFDDGPEFWDPVVGVQLHYFPNPRVPINLKADIGGFGAGTNLSWTTTLYGGYTVSPSIDLIAGISVYGANYESEAEGVTGKHIDLDMVMYGFNMGMVYHIPKRYKDKAIFKK